MIPDFRAKIASAARAPEGLTDHQLIEHVRNQTRTNQTLWDLLSRSRTPIRKPWAAVGIGEYVLERESGALWTVTGRLPGEDEIEFRLLSPGGETRTWSMRRSDEVTVFEPSPLANGAEILAAELGARYADA